MLPQVTGRAVGRLNWPIMRWLAALLVGIAALIVVGVNTALPSGGTDFYWLLDASRSVLAGEELYGRGDQPYLYSPWLAWALIPFMWLSYGVALGVGRCILFAALVTALWPMLRARRLEGYMAAALIGAFGFNALWTGHFQPIMVAILVFGIPTRWGPVAIGVAASLKILPLVLALRYGRLRQWRNLCVALAVAGLLWAPALLYGIDGYGLPIDQNISILGYSPIAFAIIGIAGLVAAWRFSPTRYGWLALAVSWLAVLPRINLYDVSGLAVGAAGYAYRDGGGRVVGSPITERGAVRRLSGAAASPVSGTGWTRARRA